MWPGPPWYSRVESPESSHEALQGIITFHKREREREREREFRLQYLPILKVRCYRMYDSLDKIVTT
jgi:hypothetical protein